MKKEGYNKVIPICQVAVGSAVTWPWFLENVEHTFDHVLST